MDPKHPDRGLTQLSPTDAKLIERLIAGASLDEVMDSEQPQRVERASRLLSLLERWEAEEAEAGLSGRTLTGVLTAQPIGLSASDGLALNALLSLRRQGLSDGPMPAGSRERAGGVSRVLGLLDRAADEPVPGGLVDRTMRLVERDREAQRRLSVVPAQAVSGQRYFGGSIRQVATTAALLLMVLSVLLPMLDRGRRDAMIAQCSQNLAGLGSDLQQVAFDNKGAARGTDGQPAAGIFDPLSRFARHELDGSPVPASQVSLFVLRDEQRVSSEHLACPAAAREAEAYYNGQNPLAGGPLRIFLNPRPIFADTNPLYRVTPRGLVRKADVPSLTQSSNHDGVGQNVLISDGSVRWMQRPAVASEQLSSDNIWLYQPSEKQDSAPDIFLTP